MSHAFDTDGMDHCPFMPVFGPPAISFERGAGTELWDTAGKRYLDFLTGLAVCSLGHANPVIAAAIAEQASSLLHVSNFFANPQATSAAIKVNELLHGATGEHGQVFFTNSGAESNECALKLARKWGGRGRHGVVSLFDSFHGRTLASLAATGQPAKHEPFAPMPDGFKHVALGDIDAMRAAVDASVAAVIIEPIQGEGGVNPVEPEYLRAVRALCDEMGALLILDEVQAGFARTGAWFGFELAGVVPDVVTMAKAMGNGMPVGACWARTEVAGVFQPGDHGSTYSGTAIATAAVSAVIDEMRRIDAPALARTQGAKLTAALLEMPQIESVRGSGLMLGAAVADGIDAAAVFRAALERGLICNAVNASTLRFLPPLTVSDAELDEAISILNRRFRGRRSMTGSFLDVTDLDGDELRLVLELAGRRIADLGRPLDGQGAALIFEKPSNRTRHSMEMAVVQLGGHPVYTRGEEVGFDTREPVEDIAAIMSGYHGLIAARVFEHSVVERLAAVASRPGREHAERPVAPAPGVSPTRSRCSSAWAI